MTKAKRCTVAIGVAVFGALVILAYLQTPVLLAVVIATIAGTIARLLCRW